MEVRVAILTSVCIFALVGLSLLLFDGNVSSINSILNYSEFLNLDSSPIILGLMPFVCYIFIKTEFKKIDPKILKQISSYSLLIILASTLITTPIGMSSSYFPPAFATDDNSTTSEQTINDPNFVQTINSTEASPSPDPISENVDSVESTTSSSGNQTASSLAAENSSNQINSTDVHPPSDPIFEEDDSVELIASNSTQTNSTESGVGNNTDNSTEASPSPDPISENETSVESTTSIQIINSTVKISENLLISSLKLFNYDEIIQNSTYGEEQLGLTDKLMLKINNYLKG